MHISNEPRAFFSKCTEIFAVNDLTDDTIEIMDFPLPSKAKFD